MQRKPVIDVLKGLAIVLVVYGHILQRVMVLANQDFFAHPVYKIIYTFHMPVFFLLSGYLLAQSLGRGSVGDIFRNRYRSLLVPYLAWTILQLPLYYIFNALSGVNIPVNPLSLLEIWLIKPDIWFLWTLFFCAVFVLAAVKFEKFLGPLVFVAPFLGLWAIPDKESFALYYIAWFYPFFLAGFGIGRLDPSIFEKFNHPAVLAGIFISFIFMVMFWSKNDFVYVHHMKFSSAGFWENLAHLIFRYGTGFLGIACAAFAAVILAGTGSSRFWEALGVYSLDIYLLQRFFVEAILPRILSGLKISLDAHSPFFLVLIAPCLTGVFAGLCILVSQFMIRRISLLDRLLLGGRRAG